MGMPKS
jgi:hypothetical protein